MSKNLPIYKTLEYTETLPISNTVVKFRPYNVGDEKNLIAAQAARDNDPQFYIDNTLNVVKGAIVNGVSIDALPSTDVRFLLLKQRAKSVGEVIEFTHKKKTYSFNIDDLYVNNKRKESDYKVDIGNGYFLKMQDFTFGEEVKASGTVVKGKEYETFYKLIVSSINSIYTEQDIWVIGEDISVEDAESFLFAIPKENAKPIYDFIEAMPTLAVDVEIDGKKVTLTDRDVDFLGSVSTT